MHAEEPLAEALARTDEVHITVRGRRTGRPITVPVWFVYQEDTVRLLPAHGTRSQWFRNLLADPTITLRAGGHKITRQARPVVDAARAQELRARFEARYGAGQVARYYAPSDALVEVSLRAAGTQPPGRPEQAQEEVGMAELEKKYEVRRIADSATVDDGFVLRVLKDPAGWLAAWYYASITRNTRLRDELRGWLMRNQPTDATLGTEGGQNRDLLLDVERIVREAA